MVGDFVGVTIWNRAEIHAVGIIIDEVVGYMSILWLY